MLMVFFLYIHRMLHVFREKATIFFHSFAKHFHGKKGLPRRHLNFPYDKKVKKHIQKNTYFVAKMYHNFVNIA